MSAVLLGVFSDYETAERVRIELVRDGFPTDRVDVTACCEPGRAGLQPAKSLHDKLAQYFSTIFTNEDERRYGEQLADRVEAGAATVTVHPRGEIEATRATQILYDAEPVEVAQHDLANQAMEHAASRHEGAWIKNFWVPDTGEYHCIYCRLFERDVH